MDKSKVKDSFNDFLKSDKANQKEFDRRITQALETAKKAWQVEFDKLQDFCDKQSKGLLQFKKENDAFKLKEEALELAKAKKMDLDLLNLLDFSNMSRDQLENKIDWIVECFNKSLGKHIQNNQLILSEGISDSILGTDLSDDDISNHIITIGEKKYKVASVGINWVDIELK